MYTVVNDFRDAKNDFYLYRAGDEYPVAGYKPTKARIEELAKGKNKYGKVFIEETPMNPAEPQTPDPNNGEGKPDSKTNEGTPKE